MTPKPTVLSLALPFDATTTRSPSAITARYTRETLKDISVYLAYNNCALRGVGLAQVDMDDAGSIMKNLKEDYMSSQALHEPQVAPLQTIFVNLFYGRKSTSQFINFR